MSNPEGENSSASAQQSFRDWNARMHERLEGAKEDVARQNQSNQNAVYAQLQKAQPHPCNGLAEDFVRVLTFASNEKFTDTASELYTCMFKPEERQEVLDRHREKLRIRLEQLEALRAEQAQNEN